MTRLVNNLFLSTLLLAPLACWLGRFVPSQACQKKKKKALTFDQISNILTSTRQVLLCESQAQKLGLTCCWFRCSCKHSNAAQMCWPVRFLSLPFVKGNSTAASRSRKPVRMSSADLMGLCLFFYSPQLFQDAHFCTKNIPWTRFAVVHTCKNKRYG